MEGQQKHQQHQQQNGPSHTLTATACWRPPRAAPCAAHACQVFLPWFRLRTLLVPPLPPFSFSLCFSNDVREAVSAPCCCWRGGGQQAGGSGVGRPCMQGARRAVQPPLSGAVPDSRPQRSSFRESARGPEGPHHAAPCSHAALGQPRGAAGRARSAWQPRGR
jgi:hypothetical protein